MNDYRSYFDRVKVSNTLHQRLLSGERAEKKRAPVLVRYGSMAACLALICLAGFGVWRWSTPQMGGDITAGDSLIPGEKDTYGPGETPPVLAGDEYVLSPAETLYTPTKVTRVNFEGGKELAASIAMPEGWFEEKLTRKQMVTLLGGGEKDDAPWHLQWSGYNITGIAIYDGTGKLWRVELQGVERADDKNSFSMTLRSGALPEDCVVENKEATVVNGVSVAGSKGQYGWDDSGQMGEVRKLTFMAGDVGVSYRGYHRSGERAEVLASRVAQCYAGVPDAAKLFTLSLDGLDPYDGEVPVWRSEKLTLAQARAEEGFGNYVPTWVPDRFGFESSWRELGQNRDWLSVCWTGYYTDISISIYRTELYPQADSDEAPIPVAELTDDLLMAQFQYVDSDAGDVSGYRARFSVDYGDGFTAQYNIKGVTPEEAVKLLDTPKTAVGAWGWPMPGNYTISTPFGTRVNPLTGREHSSNGLGIKADRGTEVLAAADGTVDQAGYDETLGNYVKLNHGDDRFTLYGHVSGKDWKAGDSVKQGEVLGQVDQSGTATGPFLYLEFLIDGEYIDPLGQYASLRESFRYQ